MVTLWIERYRHLMDPELRNVRCAHINNMHKLSVTCERECTFDYLQLSLHAQTVSACTDCLCIMHLAMCHVVMCHVSV